MIHYHGTPITPTRVILELAGSSFCVSHARPDQVALVHRIGESVLLDCGAYSAFTRGHAPDWPSYYAWCDPWLDHATTWAIIPDQIDGGSQLQDALIGEWPFGEKGAPVWHTGEPIERLIRLLDQWPRVAIGSTDEHWRVLSAPWQARLDAAWNAIAARHRRTPWVHMLRGMATAVHRWPFASADSTDVGQNHNRMQNDPTKMARRWNAANPPGRWSIRHAHPELPFHDPEPAPEAAE